MIELKGATKRYGSTLAVDDLTFTVRAGHVTGFLGLNGSGKSTTMRLILGLDTPTSGTATVNGRAYVDLPAPLREVGALLDAGALHPGRTARNHLHALALSNAIDVSRVDAVLETVGLTSAADRRAGGFSLGMRQRLGIAAALLGDPGVVLLDEPVNGLDTDGIRWVRNLVKGLAAEGRAVFVSSHLMSEMELTADRLIVIGRGHLLADTTVSDFIDAHSRATIVVRSPRHTELLEALGRIGATAEPDGDGAWRVAGADTTQVGDAAAARGIPLHELRTVRSSLEDVYTELTNPSVTYRSRPDSPAERLATGAA